jgi:hypothetical protein
MLLDAILLFHDFVDFENRVEQNRVADFLIVTKAYECL